MGSRSYLLKGLTPCLFPWGKAPMLPARNKEYSYSPLIPSVMRAADLRSE